MTNKIALGLGLVILAALALDIILYGADTLVFLGKKFADLLQWVAFWR